MACPHWCGWTASNSLRSWVDESGRKNIFEVGHPSSLAFRCQIKFLILNLFLPVRRSSDSDWIISLGSLLLQLSQSRWENGPPHSWKPILCMSVPVGVYKVCLYCYSFILQPNTAHTYSLQGRALSFLYLHRLLHLNWECWGIGDQSAAMATKWGHRGNQVRGTLVNSVHH